MSSSTAIGVDPLFGIEETTEVLSEDLRGFLVKAHRAGGRLRRSAIITIDGKPGYAVTMAYRGEL